MSADFFRKMLRFGLCAWALCQPLSVAGANIATGIIAAALLGYALTAREFPSLKSPLSKPLWIYLGVAILASAFGVDPKISFLTDSLRSDFHKVLFFYIFLAAFALDSSLTVLAWWAAGFAVAAAIGLFQVAGWYGPAALHAALGNWSRASNLLKWLAPSMRATGTINAVSYGEIMAMALIGGICFAAMRKKETGHAASKTIFFCVLPMLALILSDTRGAWLGAGFALALLLFLEPAKTWLVEIVLGIPAATVAFFADRYANPNFTPLARLHSIFSLTYISNLLRLEVWQVAWRMFLDHPLLGVGLRNYKTLFGHYHSLPFYGQNSWGNPHNLYLLQLSERGLIGLTALAFLLGIMAYRSWKNYRASPSFLNLWFLCWFAGFLIMNLTESAFQVAMLWMPTLALYCLMERSAGTNKDTTSQTS